VKITSLCFTLYIDPYTNIQNQVYGDIYIYKLLLRIESLQNYLVSQIFILFFDFWLNLAKEKKKKGHSGLLGKVYGTKRGYWEQHEECRNLWEQHKE
jgi:hypothetical protein